MATWSLRFYIRGFCKSYYGETVSSVGRATQAIGESPNLVWAEGSSPSLLLLYFLARTRAFMFYRKEKKV